MKFSEVKKGLDRKAAYFWQKRGDRYALVNAFTLKTVTGTNYRIDALKLTEALNSDGFTVAKLEDNFGAS